MQNAINSDGTKTFPTGKGITLGDNTTGSTGFPSAAGAYVDFSTYGGSTASTWRRDFTIWKWYNLERWYLRGYSNVDGSPLSWNEIWHSGNLLNIGTTASSARTALGLGSMATETASNYLPLAGGTLTNRLIVDNSSAGDGGWNKAGILIRNNNATAGETALAMQNIATSTNY